MPNSNIKINPEALEIYNKFKSGEYLRIVKAKINPYKWYILGALVLFGLLLAIAIGRSISGRANTTFVPPMIDITTPTQSAQKVSVFSALRRSILDFTTTLPDPAIPVYDNNLNLERTL